MKKVLLAMFFVISAAGFTMAQTNPAPKVVAKHENKTAKKSEKADQKTDKSEKKTSKHPKHHAKVVKH